MPFRRAEQATSSTDAAHSGARLLRQSEERFRLMVSQSHVVIWQAELPTFRFTYVSQFAQTLLGYELLWVQPLAILLGVWLALQNTDWAYLVGSGDDPGGGGIVFVPLSFGGIAGIVEEEHIDPTLPLAGHPFLSDGNEDANNTPPADDDTPGDLDVTRHEFVGQIIISGGSGVQNFALVAGWTPSNPLFSQGAQLDYAIAGNVLTGYVPGGQGSDRVVFTLEVSPTGLLTFTIFDQLDHPIANVEDLLDIDFSGLVLVSDPVAGFILVLDGVSNMETGSNTPNLQLSVDAIAEVRILVQACAVTETARVAAVQRLTDGRGAVCLTCVNRDGEVVGRRVVERELVLRRWVAVLGAGEVVGDDAAILEGDGDLCGVQRFIRRSMPQ